MKGTTKCSAALYSVHGKLNVTICVRTHFQIYMNCYIKLLLNI